MPLLPGQTLNNRYRIVTLLAEGAYGAVYRAWDIIDKRDYAIKEYRDSSPETQRLFRAEARRLSRLEHPQLPKIRDHFNLENAGQYLVSDFIDGVDLGSLLAQYGPLPSDLIVEWLQAVCQPLNYLHEQKTVHLNIKPANIRVTPARDVFLVDSGFPGLGISVGTSGYAAPEQTQQVAISPASDIYSLGATLYTLLTGNTPPDALHRQSGLNVMLPAREVNPNLEPYLSIVANQAMDLNSEARYQSATAFATALSRPAGHAQQQYNALRRTVDAPVVPPPRLPSRARRQLQKRTMYGLIGVLAAIILFGAAAIALSDRIQVVGNNVVEGTATVQSQIIAALTQLAPTITSTPPPTGTPAPTPTPFVDRQTGAQMIFVPRSAFRFGNDEGEDDEAPSSVIRVDEFLIDEVEVTNGQYKKCVDAGICNPPLNPNATFHPAYFGDAAFSEYPVIFVNWFDADTFCKWRNARLPTEAEWEKAAGYDPINLVKYRYPWGDEFEGAAANFCDVNCPTENQNAAFDDGNRDTSRVGSYGNGRSPIGAYDMAGNVMEWVADWYDAREYAGISDINPRGPLEGEAKVLRGGSWLAEMGTLSTTARAKREPTVARAHIGFRCALTPP